MQFRLPRRLAPRLARAFLVLAFVAARPGAAAAETAGLPKGVELSYAAGSAADSAELAVKAYSAGPFDEGKELKGVLEGAWIQLDRDSLGRSPYTGLKLKPGRYRCRIEASGYESLLFDLDLVAGKRAELVVRLVRETGFLLVQALPRDAELSWDGKELEQGLNRLPTGSRLVRARRFGYVEAEVRVEILRGLTSSLSIGLERAPFEVGGLRSSRESFNPRNAGPAGRAALSFRVESWGRGRLEIRDAAGALVAAKEFPPFRDWEQEFSWSGEDEAGEPLPDGRYQALLVARAEEESGTPIADAPELRRELELRIDGSLRVEPLGLLGGSPGLLHLPASTRIAAGTPYLDAGLSASIGPEGFAEPRLGFEAALSLEELLLGLGASLGVDPEREGEAELHAAALFRLGGLGPVGTGAWLRLSWAAAGSGRAPGALGEGAALLALLPMELELGGLKLGAAPGLVLGFDGGDLALGLEGRAGARLSSAAWMLGVSARFGHGLVARGAELGLALEGRVILDPSPLVLWFLAERRSAAGSAGDLLRAESLAAPSLSLGLGLVF